MMVLIDEPGTGRLFVGDMRGPLYTVTYDGRTVTQYLDVNAERWGVRVRSPRRGLGVQSFAFHFVAAARWLKARPDCNARIAATGFCFGGSMSNTLAVLLGADLAAAAPFYGGGAAAVDVPKFRAAMPGRARLRGSTDSRAVRPSSDQLQA